MQHMRARHGTIFDHHRAMIGDSGSLGFWNAKTPGNKPWNHLPGRCESEGWGQCGSEVFVRFNTEEESMVY